MGNYYTILHDMAFASTLLALVQVIQPVVATGDHGGGVAAHLPEQQPPTKLISDAPSCRGCTIEFVKVNTVVSRANDAELAVSPTLAVNSKGVFFATNTSRDRVLVYDSSGRYQRAFGRAGRGPGEIRRVTSLVVGPGDSIWVSQGNNIHFVFSPTGEFVRGVTLQSAGALHPLASGDLLQTSAPPRTGPMAGTNVRILNPDGTLLRALSGPTLNDDPACEQCKTRFVVASPGGNHIWVLWRTRYRIEKWTTSGRLEQVIERQAPWFPARTVDYDGWGEAYAVGPVVRPGDPPPPPLQISERGKEILATRPSEASWLVEDSDGLLWVKLEQRVRPGEMRAILEVIDPVRGELLATIVPPAIQPLKNGLVVGPRESADGLISFDVFRLTLRR
jgi:hypothetical protein